MHLSLQNCDNLIENFRDSLTTGLKAELYIAAVCWTLESLSLPETSISVCFLHHN